MDLGIAGKRVLVTGASQGIGRAIARGFAGEGCRVAVLARREEELEAVVAEMGGREKGHACCAVDLMPPGAPTQAVRKLTEDQEPFAIVVHNVGGTLGMKQPLAPMEDWQRVWRFNVGIAQEINALVIPPMQDRRWGRVIHISSVAALDLRGSCGYGPAKAYLNAYTKVLARALAPSGVVVSAVLPGAVYAPGGHWDWVRDNKPAMLEDFLRHHHAVGRLGQAGEIVPFVLLLASQQASFAQGALVNVDGGTM
ncbi:MAG: SDR family oxidoreductase [Sedimentisphaerales bacterium]|nr:SDR family oxidoreductase [Sedimentisphaerales bacterium]